MFTPRIPSLGALPSSGFVPGRRLGAAPSGYRYLADEVPFTSLAANFLASSTYSGPCSNILVDITQSDISFDNKVSSTGDWDAATDSGVDTAVSSIWYDQVGGHDYAQINSTRATGALRNGGVDSDGVNDHYDSPTPFVNTTDFSFYFIYEGTEVPASFDRFFDTNDDVNRTRVEIGGGLFALKINGADKGFVNYGTFFDGVRKVVIGTYNSVTGWKVEINGVNQSIASNVGGVITDAASKIYAMSRNGGTGSVPGVFSAIGFYDGGWDQLDFDNAFEISSENVAA